MLKTQLLTSQVKTPKIYFPHGCVPVEFSWMVLLVVQEKLLFQQNKNKPVVIEMMQGQWTTYCVILKPQIESQAKIIQWTKTSQVWYFWD